MGSSKLRISVNGLAAPGRQGNDTLNVYRFLAD
jgi:hypothetical protein